MWYFYCNIFKINRWYYPNYQLAKEITYGKGAGCSFLSNGCLAYGKYPFQFKESPKDKAYRCNPNNEYAEKVWFSQFNKVPRNQRYFPNDPRKGGMEPADYCPVWTVSSQTWSNSWKINYNNLRSSGLSWWRWQGK